MSSADFNADELLDRMLADVPVPDGLRERLAADVVADDAIDRRLRDVPIPLGLKYRLRAIAMPTRWRSRSLVAAAAAILLFCVYQAAGFVQWAIRGSYTARPYLQATYVPTNTRYYGPSPDFIEPPSVRPAAEWSPPPLPRPLADLKGRGNLLVAARVSRPTRRLGPDPLDLLAATGDYDRVLFGPPTDPPADPTRSLWRVPRGLEVALNAADRTFLLDRGVFPFVTPREFAQSTVPPTSDTTSFEEARALIRSGEWPEAQHVRAEEFLAAADYRLPRPAADAGPLRLSVAGSIAPWSPTPNPTMPLPPERTTRLLQIAVQAGEPAPEPRKPTYLTVAVDVTDSMRSGERLTLVKAALRAVVGRLGGNDRLTLTTIGGSNSVIIEEAGRAEIDQLLAAVDWLEIGRSGALAQGTLAAISAAGRRELPKQVVRRLVVISDSFDVFDPLGTRTIEQLLRTSAARGLELYPIDVAQAGEIAAWDELARQSGGKTFRVGTSERLRSALMEVLTGRSQLIASGGVVSVSFNPQCVVGYRLIGYEPSAAAALGPQPTEIDLHAGQGVTLLYEVVLNGDRSTEIGKASVRWHDAVDGSAKSQELPISRAALGSTFDRASPNVQLAAIATAVAGRLRNSPWGDNVAPAEVLQWAARLDRARLGRSLEPWIALLDQMQRMPPRRGAARGNR